MSRRTQYFMSGRRFEKLHRTVGNIRLQKSVKHFVDWSSCKQRLFKKLKSHFRQKRFCGNFIFWFPFHDPPKYVVSQWKMFFLSFFLLVRCCCARPRFISALGYTPWKWSGQLFICFCLSYSNTRTHTHSLTLKSAHPLALLWMRLINVLYICVKLSTLTTFSININSLNGCHEKERECEREREDREREGEKERKPLYYCLQHMREANVNLLI